ncbi:MAG TPA: FecR domain-containing protein, partial [Hyphomicrobiaceae bacterium]|nr:FecR domain-containing protein [Hyphomicrobiaceae bacterium]
MRMVIALILVFLPAVAVGQPSQGVVTLLLGQATLTRRAPVTPQPLRFKDDLFEHDRINTGERSLVRVLLGAKALVTVRELSAFTITEEARNQTVRLTWGKLAVSVVHSRMRPGEAIEIRTPNAIAAVRGTVVIVEVLPPTIPGATPNTLITVTRGTVGVTRADRIGSAEVAVRAGLVYDVAADRLRALAPAETASTWADLLGGPQFLSLPEDFSRGLWRGELERLATGTSVLLGTDTPTTPWATVLDQAFRTSPLSLLLGVTASGLSGGGGTIGRGCGGGVGGGAGVGCAGLGQGAANGN